jgi:hypothetical protein
LSEIPELLLLSANQNRRGCKKHNRQTIALAAGRQPERPWAKPCVRPEFAGEIVKFGCP